MIGEDLDSIVITSHVFCFVWIIILKNIKINNFGFKSISKPFAISDKTKTKLYYTI